MPDMDKQKDDHVSIPRILRRHYHAFAIFFIILVIGYSVVEIGLKVIWESLSNGLLERISVLMTLVIGFFFIISYIYAFFLSRRERQASKIYDEAKKASETEVLNKAEEFLQQGKTLREFVDALEK